MASLIFNWKLVEAESRILKQSSEQRERQFSEVLKIVAPFVQKIVLKSSTLLQQVSN